MEEVSRPFARYGGLLTCTGWCRIVVCIVSDGRAKIDARTLKILGLYGAYQDGIAKDTVDGKDVTAHLFE